VVFALCLAFHSATAADGAVFVPVPNSPIRLEMFEYLPPGDGQFPVIIFNHGSAGGHPEASLPSQPIADYFVKRGFIVLVPMRRGRGRSSGVSFESEAKNCDPASWETGLQISFEDLSAVFEYIPHVAKANPSAVILAGASRGGFLSVAYAASGKYRQHIASVINFVGGWVAQAEDNCQIDFNYVSFAKFGSETKVPMLWLYGLHDAYFTAESIESYFKVFVARGGNARFQFVDGVPQNGHWLPAYPELWTKSVDTFLKAH
jgi:dienelactone hydrolase